jgi:hypothetical protein
VVSNPYKPQTIVGFSIDAPVFIEDVTEVNDLERVYKFTPKQCLAQITITRGVGYELLESEIALPPELREKIRAILQEHLDNTGQRT